MAYEGNNLLLSLPKFVGWLAMGTYSFGNVLGLQLEKAQAESLKV